MEAWEDTWCAMCRFVFWSFCLSSVLLDPQKQVPAHPNDNFALLVRFNHISA